MKILEIFCLEETQYHIKNKNTKYKNSKFYNRLTITYIYMMNKKFDNIQQVISNMLSHLYR